MKVRLSLLSLVVTASFLFASATPFIEHISDDSNIGANTQKDFAGYIPISTPQELAKIGRDIAYPVSGKYYLVNDIVFGNTDANEGADIHLKATMSGGDLTLLITPPGGAISTLTAWIDTIQAVNLNSNTVKVSSAPSGIYTLTVAGQYSYGGFVHSMQIDTRTDGVKVDKTFRNNGNFDPIGYNGIYSYSPFTGTFDGNGKKIIGMDVALFHSTSEYQYGGLFARTNGAEVLDLGIEGGSVTVAAARYPYASHRTYAGGIVGYAESTTITNCYNTNMVVAATSSLSASAGGIAGYTSSTTITSCYNVGSIVAMSERYPLTGGIVGSVMSTTVAQCYNVGSVVAAIPGQNLASAGGIVGYESSSLVEITDCYNMGSVSAKTPSTGATHAGGILGTGQMRISNCYNTGYVEATSSLGANTEGITGAFVGGIVASGPVGSIIVTNCYFLEGHMKINGLQVTDKIDHRGYATVDGNNNTPRPAAQESGAKSAFELKPSLPDAVHSDASAYYTGITSVQGILVEGWDFEKTWTIDEKINNGYPTLRSILWTQHTTDPDPDGFPTMIVAIVGIVIVATGGGLFFFMRKR